MAYDLPKYIVISLVCTIVIEVLLAIIFKARKKKDIFNVVLVNAITNPIVVVVPYVLQLYFGLNYRYIALFILEILAIFIEGYIYKKVLKYNKINYYMLSIILNVSSYLIGNVLNNYIY